MADKKKSRTSESKKSELPLKDPGVSPRVESEEPNHFPSKEERTPGVKRQNLPHDPMKSSKDAGNPKETTSVPKSTSSGRVDPK